MANQPGKDETIRVKRRRQGASSGPQSGERADSQSRQRPGSGGTRPPSYGGGGGGGGGGGLGGNAPKMSIGMVILLAIAYFLFNQFFGGSPSTDTGQPQQPNIYEQATEPVSGPVAAVPTAARTRIPTTQPGQGATPGQKWTVMLYQDADDQILEQDIYIDLNEAERVGSSDRVQIVSQIDRYRGAFTGDGNWTNTRRYHLTQDDDLQNVNSELVQDAGEQNMARGSTLVDFITWAAETYPADKYILILSDHGMGWPGGFSDPDPASKDPSRAPLAAALQDDNLYMMEMDEALNKALQQANIDQLEMIGMDACLMGHIEVLSALQPYARYAVLSQETEPALGWAYTSFLQALVDNPDMSGAEISQMIVDSYIRDDQRVVDSQARADFLRQGSPFGGLFGSSSQMSAAALARQLERSVTLTAVDMAKIPALVDSVNSLAYSLQNEDENLVASARTYAPSFTNIFGKDSPSPYIDLGGFAQMLKRQGASAETGQAADQVMASLQDAIVAEKHGEGKPGATGISIYFPNSTLYRSALAGPQSYTAIANRFAQDSLWDNFLVFFYNSVGFERQPAQPIAPNPGEPSRTPGLGQVQISPIKLSSDTASPNNPVTVSAKVTGQNIGYIMLFVGQYDAAANSIFQADTDYLESPETRELNGVYYPVWSDNQSFNLELNWEPTVFQVSDGKTTTVALFEPETYGASAQETVYTIEGIYNYADGASRSARMYFRDGMMRQVFGFTDENQTGGLFEIIPHAGDSFTILEKWLDLDNSGKVVQPARQEGTVLTFGDQPFTWKEVYAAQGEYLIGIIVQDLDGNRQEQYTTISVR